jgi:hypothetical protein
MEVFPLMFGRQTSRVSIKEVIPWKDLALVLFIS